MNGEFIPFLGEDVLHRKRACDPHQNPEARIAEGLATEPAVSQIDVGLGGRRGIFCEIFHAGISVEDLAHISGAWTT
jgi:hypothetical protein